MTPGYMRVPALRGRKLQDATRSAKARYLAGMTLQEIADSLDPPRSLGTVRNWLISAGVPLRPRGTRGRISTNRLLAVRMRKKKLSYTEIGLYFGVSRQAVAQIFQRWGES